ncbi:MAG TPA: flagellar hook-associated protein FlgL [Candidatus Binatia bacterium]|nr:flagellar hook-associated protein FlgL [Candidatus Binatia bacterium]
MTAVSRIADIQIFDQLRTQATGLEASLAGLQAQVSSGKRFQTADADPLAAGQVLRTDTAIGALGQYSSATQFGTSVLGAEDSALGDAVQIMTRAQEIATEQANGTVTASDRAAAAEEVHGLLQALTSIGNTELSGRRLFGGLALDAPAPFASPDSAGYDAATAYSGSTQGFEIKVGSAPSERVRISTSGDAVFTSSLVALQNLETALRTNGDVAGQITALQQGQQAISTEQTSVGARENQLQTLQSQQSSLTLDEQTTLSNLQDADLASVLSQLTQGQVALQAVLQAGAMIAQTTLAGLLKL